MDAPVTLAPVVVTGTPELVERAATIEWAMRQFGVELDMAVDIYEVATEVGIEPRIAFGLVSVESGFYERARGKAGEIGLTQVMPSTARFIVPGITEQELYDRRTNLRVGFTYLRDMLHRYESERLALLAYNRGPGTVNRYLKSGLDPENGYARKVLARAA